MFRSVKFAYCCVLSTFVTWGCSQGASKAPSIGPDQPPSVGLSDASTTAGVRTPDATLTVSEPDAPTATAPPIKPGWRSVSLAKADRDRRFANLRLDVACKVDADCGVLNTLLTGNLACCTPGSCRELVVANKRSIALLTKRCQQDQLLRKPKPEGWTPCPPWDCNETPDAQCENKVCVMTSEF
jgi:hypothetical protein